MSNNYVAVAKFFVYSVKKNGHTDYASGKPVVDGIEIVLNPVSYRADDPTHENSKFWTASPSGEMKLYINNPNLFDKFEVGQEIYLPMMLADGLNLADLSGALHSIPVAAPAS